MHASFLSCMSCDTISRNRVHFGQCLWCYRPLVLRANSSASRHLLQHPRAQITPVAVDGPCDVETAGAEEMHTIVLGICRAAILIRSAFRNASRSIKLSHFFVSRWAGKGGDEFVGPAVLEFRGDSCTKDAKARCSNSEVQILVCN